MERYKNEEITKFNWAQAILKFLSIDRGISPNEREAIKTSMTLSTELAHILDIVKNEECCIKDGELLYVDTNTTGEKIWKKVVRDDVKKIVYGEED